METTARGTRAAEIGDRLTAQHQHLRHLVEEVRTSGGEERAGAFVELRRYLAAHEVVEQNSLHPVLGHGSTDSGDIGARVAEERRATDDLERLERLDLDGREFADAFDAWSEALMAHADAEERDEVGARLDEVGEHESTMVLRILEQVDAIAASEAMQEAAAADGGFAAMVDAARLEVSRRLD
ncbi:hypothetical protein GCM10027517_08480 [Phycicoccus ginsengisoli]